MVYMLRISREQEKKANWEIVLVLIMLDFLYMLPPQGPTPPGCKGGPSEAVLQAWQLCSDIIIHLSRTLGKPHSCFCASHCVLASLST